MANQLFSLSAMARRLGVTCGWLRSEAEAGRVPCLTAGDRLLFLADEVERVLIERARNQQREVAHAR